jgi:hypothetical protein
MAKNVDALVLGTVNASWKRTVDAEQLAYALAGHETEEYLLHLVTLFGEVSPKLVMTFAAGHDIAPQTLRDTYLHVKRLTGEASPSLEPLLVGLG